MNDFISRHLWWKNSKEETTREEYVEGFHGILESAAERRKMSPSRLAIRLSSCDKDSPAYILLTHELNRRIAQVQSAATYVGTASALLGIVVGTFLQAFFTSQTPQNIVQCQCSSTTKNEAQRPAAEPLAPSFKSVVKQRDDKSQQKSTNGNVNP